jgi:hypothetical protein
MKMDVTSTTRESAQKCIRILSLKPKEMESLGKPVLCRKILQCILEKELKKEGKVSTGLFWLRAATRGGFLLMQ